MTYADLMNCMSPAEKENFMVTALNNERDLKTCEGENRTLIDQINTLEHEKAELEMKLGAAESNLWSAEHKRKQAFDLLTAIGNGQVPQAEIWQKINDIVNLPF